MLQFFKNAGTLLPISGLTKYPLHKKEKPGFVLKSTQKVQKVQIQIQEACICTVFYEIHWPKCVLFMHRFVMMQFRSCVDQNTNILNLIQYFHPTTSVSLL
jgi:hypothetical protein